MPIGVSSFPIVDNNLAERLFGGFQQGQNLHRNYLANELAKIQNQQQQTRSQFLAPSLQEKLQKAIYENQIQRPIAENADQFAMAKLAAEKAQAPYLNSQAGFNISKTKGQDIENQFAPDKLMAQIANTKATTNTKNITPLQKELGKQDAKFVGDLDRTYSNSQKKLATLNDVSNILTSPTFQQIRQNPLFGRQELSYYGKFGTPEQQNLIGQYQASTGEIIKDASRDFAGQFRKGEQSLLESMKPNAKDTIDVASGKVQALTVMTKMLSERAKVMSNLIRKEGKTPTEAADIADKLVDGNKIRQEIEDKLSPRITIKNKKTGETKQVTREEARKLGVI